jgi:SAM-dependent methyltransferase
MNPNELKLVVQEKYGQIAKQSILQESVSCCGSSGCCGELEFSMIGDEYTEVKGHNVEADLGLGCGIPTQFADIKEGDSVLDLGSGAGNDCFVARAIVGERGKVTGIDFTEAMIKKACANNAKLGYTNVEFVQGDIEEMPLPDNQFDVVISNCVLNLVPDKQKAFSEIFRVIKPGGRFCVSDVVLLGDLPQNLQKDAEMYAGCVSGASRIDDYLEIVHQAGFQQPIIHKKKEIVIPQDVLSKYLNAEELEAYKLQQTGIYSITVSAHKNS